MAITLNGPSKLIVLDTATAYTWQAIYNAVVAWAVLPANMQYLIPMTSTGKAPLGGGVFTDIIFILQNGWKLQPSGYAANTQITITGSGTVSDNTSFAVAPLVGSPVQWYLQAATAGTVSIVSTGSGALSTVQAAQLSQIAASTTPLTFTGTNINADTKSMNGAAVIGTGAAGDSWRGVGVQP
jgi:hypothetical protein